jgi:adenylate cyclase
LLYSFGIISGMLVPDAAALRDTAEALRIAEESSDDLMLVGIQMTRGITLFRRDDPERAVGFDILNRVRHVAAGHATIAALLVDIHIAEEKAHRGDLDDAIALSESVVNNQFDTGEMIYRGPATAILVESLLARGAHGDLEAAQATNDRLAAVPVDPGFVLHELPLLRLRAQLARARGNDRYRDFRDKYRNRAVELRFEGHIAAAEAMT